MGKVLETQIISGSLILLKFFKFSCIIFNLFIVSSIMIIKKFSIFFITEKLNELNLDYVKKTGAILILRNIEKYKDEELKKFNNNCTRRNISLFISNNIKTLFF